MYLINYESSFGGSRSRCSKVINIHPFEWQAERSREMAASVANNGVFAGMSMTIISWQKLSQEDEDVLAANVVDLSWMMSKGVQDVFIK